MKLAFRILTALVWITMGLGAKVLGLVPRHQEIVARIVGDPHAAIITKLIGLGEIGLGIWILSGRFPRLCAGIQIALVAVMNLIEFTRARDLLLYGGWNMSIAIAFTAFVAATQWPRSPCSAD